MAEPVKVSFEFFPPNDAAAAGQLWAAVERLAPLAPKFVSVTYGADGSTRSRTHECVLRILRETHLRVAPHLTCVGAPREEITRIAQDYWAHGVRHLVALRGDPQTGASAATALFEGHAQRYRPHPGGYAYAADLVQGLKVAAPFEISVAAYPEGHPESATIEADLDNLKRKIDAGAERAITQFFFDPDVYLRYRDRCVASGIGASIVPGILPIGRFPQLVKFAERCGASIPEWLRRRFEGLDDDPETRRMIAAHVAIDQVQRLREHGVDEFHFYTLNRADLTYAICHALGLRPCAQGSAAGGAMRTAVEARVA
jgi:methylenetetrahydrofolate reductase (NADPH)